MTYYVDFMGWCKVEAETEEEAREKFYNEEFFDALYEATDIEEFEKE